MTTAIATAVLIASLAAQDVGPWPGPPTVQVEFVLEIGHYVDNVERKVRIADFQQDVAAAIAKGLNDEVGFPEFVAGEAGATSTLRVTLYVKKTEGQKESPFIKTTALGAKLVRSRGETPAYETRFRAPEDYPKDLGAPALLVEIPSVFRKWAKDETGDLRRKVLPEASYLPDDGGDVYLYAEDVREEASSEPDMTGGAVLPLNWKSIGGAGHGKSAFAIEYIEEVGRGRNTKKFPRRIRLVTEFANDAKDDDMLASASVLAGDLTANGLKLYNQGIYAEVPFPLEKKYAEDPYRTIDNHPDVALTLETEREFLGLVRVSGLYIESYEVDKDLLRNRASLANLPGNLD